MSVASTKDCFRGVLHISYHSSRLDLSGPTQQPALGFFCRWPFVWHKGLGTGNKKWAVPGWVVLILDIKSMTGLSRRQDNVAYLVATAKSKSCLLTNTLRDATLSYLRYYPTSIILFNSGMLQPNCPLIKNMFVMHLLNY